MQYITSSRYDIIPESELMKNSAVVCKILTGELEKLQIIDSGIIQEC